MSPHSRGNELVVKIWESVEDDWGKHRSDIYKILADELTYTAYTYLAAMYW